MPFNSPLINVAAGASITSDTNGTWTGNTSGIVGSANGVILTGNDHYYAIQSTSPSGSNSLYVQGTFVVTAEVNYLGIVITNATGTDGFFLGTDDRASTAQITLNNLSAGIGSPSAPVSGGEFGGNAQQLSAGEHTLSLLYQYNLSNSQVTLTATIDGTTQPPIVIAGGPSDCLYAAIQGYGSGTGNVALKDFVAYDPTGPSVAISPTTAAIGATGVSFTLTGTGTSWTSATTPELMGGTGASITAHTTNSSASPQTITGTFNASSTAGTLVFFNSTDGAAANVEVSNSVPSLTVVVSPSTATIVQGSTTPLTASNFTGGSVTWSTSAPGVATVSSSGVVTGMSPGSATITATGVSNTSQAAMAAITVTAPSAILTISPSSIPLGQVTAVTITGSSANGTWVPGAYGVYPTVASGSSSAGFSDVNNSACQASPRVITANLYGGTGSPGTLMIGNTADGVTGTVTLTAAPTTAIVNYFGASLFQGQNGTGFNTNNATRLVTVSEILGPTVEVINQGVGGNTYAMIQARIASALTPTYNSAVTNVVMLDGGAFANVINNGVTGPGGTYGTLAQGQSQFQALIAAINAAGTYKLVFCCSTPAAYPGGYYPYNYDSLRDQFNTWVLSNVSTLGISAVSVAGMGDVRIGIDGCEYNATYFSATDHTHLTDAGYTILGQSDALAIGQALAGVTLGGAASTSTDPGIANVRHGTTYEINGTSLTGTCYVPTSSQVLSGVNVDATTGNVVLPSAGQVATGVSYGAASNTTGTLAQGVTLAQVSELLSSGIVTLAPSALASVPTLQQISGLLGSGAVTLAPSALAGVPSLSQISGLLSSGVVTLSSGAMAGVPTLNQISGLLSSGVVTLAPNGIDAIDVESGVNSRQALSLILAASAGLVSGAGTGTIAIKGANVDSIRIVATTDNAGNRSSISLTVPN